MKELYAQHLDGVNLGNVTSVNIVATPSHRITHFNRLADEGTKQPPKTRGDWIMRRHFAFVPPAVFQDHYQLGPRELQALRSSTKGIGDLATHNRARFGEHWQPSRGLSLAWVPFHLQQRILQMRLACLPTIVKFARHLNYDDKHLDPVCMLCAGHMKPTPTPGPA